jgi:hypothetical protein
VAPGRACSSSRTTRPSRKLAANSVENDVVAADALAAHPATASVAVSLAIRKMTSSVSKRLA